jgi:hypothetical protein
MKNVLPAHRENAVGQEMKSAQSILMFVTNKKRHFKSGLDLLQDIPSLECNLEPAIECSPQLITHKSQASFLPYTFRATINAGGGPTRVLPLNSRLAHKYSFFRKLSTNPAALRIVFGTVVTHSKHRAYSCSDVCDKCPLFYKFEPSSLLSRSACVTHDLVKQQPHKLSLSL